METMKAVRYMGPEQTELCTLPIPEPARDEVLLRVRACGICGSDVHGFLGLTGRRIAPMTMGHEFSAEVVKNGADAHTFQPGDGVIVQPIHFCGTCANCMKGLTNMCLNKRFFGVLTVDGAMAEYIAVPEKLLFRLPDGCDFKVGALAEPYAVAYGCIQKAGELCGQTLMIIGAGMIGLCILQLAKLQSPKRIIMADLSDTRLELANRLGADIIVNTRGKDMAEEIDRITGGAMIDTSIEAVGVQATANMSIKCLRTGGTAVWVGMSQKEMEINMQDIVCLARRVIGSFNYTHAEFGEVVEILGSGKVASEAVISDVVSLEGVQNAMKMLHAHPDDYVKVIVDPTL